MFWYKLIILALVGGIIGYLTNTIAVKMIFRPLKPVELPFNIRIQGLIPKRREDIAKSIGEVVDKELVSVESIFGKFIENSGRDILIEKVKEKLKQAVSMNLPPIIPNVVKSMITEYANDIIDRETETFIIEAAEKFMDDAAVHVRISEIVEEKINSFEIEKLEELTIRIAKKELRYIEILGGVIGLLIGLIQGLIILNIK